MVGVTMTMSSDVDRFELLERKREPRIGNEARPGVLSSDSVVCLSSSPDIAKLWPFLNTTSVSACLVDTAGIVYPLMVTAFV